MTSPSEPIEGMFESFVLWDAKEIRRVEFPNCVLEPHCPDYDFSKITFLLPEPLASKHDLMSAAKEAIPALFTSQASVAFYHLIRVAYSLSIEGSTVRERAKKIVEDLKASASECKPQELKVDATSDSQHCDPLLDALTEENLEDYVFGIINTLSLLVKMDEPAFRNYAERRFESVARSNGLSALANLFPTSLKTQAYLKLKMSVKSSDICKQIYLLYLVQLSHPSTRRSAEALGASRLTCHEMILPSLFIQTCQQLNWQPSKLIKALDYIPFGRGSKKVEEFLKVLNGKGTLVGRYSILLSGILPHDFSKWPKDNLTVKANPNIIEMLKRINIRCGNESASRIKGSARNSNRIDDGEVERIVAGRERGLKKEITLFSS